MGATDRVVFGRSFRVTPVWVWWAQRVSGLALGPMVAVHVAAPSFAPVLVGSLLLAMVTLHGYCGLRRITPAAGRAKRAEQAAWAWASIVVASGLAVLLAS